MFSVQFMLLEHSIDELTCIGCSMPYNEITSNLVVRYTMIAFKLSFTF